MTKFIMTGLWFLLHATLSAQSLGLPEARWDREFLEIGGVAELSDGRVVIVDRRDQLVFIGAARGGSSDQLGRAGDGPNEYRRPYSLLRWLADTILVYSQNRLVRVAPTGVVAGSIPFAAASLGGSVSPPRGVDQLGRIYWDRVVIRVPGTQAIKRQQQYEIVRHQPGTDRVDVVATASDHAPEMHDKRFHPFAERDAWVVDAGGTIHVVRARDYSVARVSNGTIISVSAPIAFNRIRITAADYEAYRRSRAVNAPSISFNGRSMGASGGVTPERMALMRQDYPDGMFPPFKPPLIERGVLRSPSGQLWVIRSPEDSTLRGKVIDILDAAGKRIREISLPQGRFLAALDRRGIYLVAEDDDGLQFLERYPWPAGLK